MLTRKVRCHCRGFCSQSSRGYCLVDPRDRAKHEAADRSRTIDTQFGRDLVFRLAEELEVYTLSILPFKAAQYRPQVLVHEDYTLTSLLSDDDHSSVLYLSYERWHNEALDSLKAIHGRCITLDPSIRVLEERMIALYARTLNQAISGLKASQASERDRSLPLFSATANFLEHEISAGIKRFKFSSPLSFIPTKTHTASTLIDEYSLNLAIGSQTFNLDPQHDQSKCILDQLLWVDVILSELRTQTKAEMSSGRLDELLTGVEEHRENISIHVQSQMFAQAYESANVSKILHSNWFAVHLNIYLQLVRCVLPFTCILAKSSHDRSYGPFLEAGIPPSSEVHFHLHILSQG